MNKMLTTAAVVVAAGLAFFLVVVPALSQVFDPVIQALQVSQTTQALPSA